MNFDADVLIAGGGLVGGGLACALDGTPLRVIQVEAQPPILAADGAWDERSFALARRTVESLRALGAWDDCADDAHAIENVHVSSRGDFGAVRVRAADYGLDALGRTVPARVLARAIERRVARCTNLERLSPARLVALRVEPDAAIVTVQQGDATRELRVRLLVGADGTGSFVRDASGIGVETHDYAQTAIVTTVQVASPRPEWAYERLTETGPFALLPLASERYGLIWTVAADEAPTVLALDDDAFLAAAQARYGARLGRWLRVGRRQPWPLKLTRATSLVAPRTVLVGNAAQTIHPVGAQGFNLGLRDAMALRDHVLGAAAASQGTGFPLSREGQADRAASFPDSRRSRESGNPASSEQDAPYDDFGSATALAHYAAARRDDREATIRTADGLVRLFARDAWPLRLVRGVAMAALDRVAPLKQDLAFALMGYRGTDVPTRRAGDDRAA